MGRKPAILKRISKKKMFYFLLLAIVPVSMQSPPALAIKGGL